MKNLTWKQRLLPIVVFLAICGVLGVLVMVSGIVPVKASSGHWQITKWILNFSKARSVATHSMGIEVPPLDDPSLVLKGAGHYETGCVQCHGSPSRPASPIALSMTATPPALPPKIAVRDPEELFYIVKHGIKFTGMPAWPTQQRDDEVWAMVAFLQQLPALESRGYERLVGSTLADTATGDDADVSPKVVATCVRCHGTDGGGRGNGAYPRIAGLSRTYLQATLQAYGAGDRHSGMMQSVAAVLSEQELSALADYFASLWAGDVPDDADPAGSGLPAPAGGANAERAASLERGKAIAHAGIPEREVPSCIDCHGPVENATAAIYPRLAGQYADYLVLQLQLFRDGTRGGTDSAHLMKPVVRGLTDQDLLDVAAYYASLSLSSPDAGDAN